MKADKKQALQGQIATLERKLFEARAQYAATLVRPLTLSRKPPTTWPRALFWNLTALGGKEIIPAVMIRDGLSRATIKAIQDDLRRSFELATLVNPAMARES